MMEEELNEELKESEMFDDMYTELDNYHKATEELLQRVRNLGHSVEDIMQLQSSIGELSIAEWEFRIHQVLTIGIYHKSDHIRLVAAKVLELMIEEHLVPIQTAMPHLIASLTDPQSDIQQMSYNKLKYLQYEHFSQLPQHSVPGMRLAFTLHIGLLEDEVPKVLNQRLYLLLNDATCVSDDVCSQMAFEKILFKKLANDLIQNRGYFPYQQFLAHNLGNFPYTRLECVAFAINNLQTRLKEFIDPIYEEIIHKRTLHLRDSVLLCLLMHNLMSFLRDIYSITEKPIDILERECTLRMLNLQYEPKLTLRKQGFFDCSSLDTRVDGNIENQIATLKVIQSDLI